ncbi:hypothetical protein COU74_05290 [Candidatus Peregrinibacteria bacterium CG10_big_fil_rev_8_21_14_0_10_36_19]|nr:MAG: hypothetical protein COU74_05290 [Candidatus Peregrinibacteria bacterium CG10_big_fil_rev_8_21_14_0_10_36_19]
MGIGGEKPAMREIDDTRAAGREDAFELIVERIKGTGADVEDVSTPLFVEIDEDEFEVGEKRVVNFSLNGFDFELTRKSEEFTLQGAGHKKHVEALKTPRINIVLRKKAQFSQDWQVVDLEDMF